MDVVRLGLWVRRAQQECLELSLQCERLDPAAGSHHAYLRTSRVCETRTEQQEQFSGLGSSLT